MKHVNIRGPCRSSVQPKTTLIPGPLSISVVNVDNRRKSASLNTTSSSKKEGQLGHSQVPLSLTKYRKSASPRKPRAVRPWTSQSRSTDSDSRSNRGQKVKARPKTTADRRRSSQLSDLLGDSQGNAAVTKLGVNNNRQLTESSGDDPGDDLPITNPWSATELVPDDYENEPFPPTKDEDFSAHGSDISSECSEDASPRLEEAEDAGTEDADALAAEAGGDEDGEDEEDKLSTDGQDLKTWLAGSAYNSDDYDTDLEEDFPPEPEPPVDPTGAYTYGEKCKRGGIVPVSYLVRNLGDGNLRMRHHYLGGVGTKPLAHALKNNTVCEEIDLSDNYMEGDGAAALAGMLKDNMFIVNLNISHNFIKSEGAAAFAEMLEANTTLKTLSLKGNQMSDWDAKKISDAMKNNMSLVCLDLSNNSFGERAGVHLAVGISSNIGLNDLDLSWNGIREKGAVAVAKALSKNTSLEIFDISWNGFANVGTVALAQSIRVNKSLKVLDISNNRIDTEAAKRLGLGLARNKGLETLLLGMNPIGEEGVEALLKGIEKNTSLKLVGLEDISVCPRLQKKIKEITSQRDIMIMYSSGSPQQSKINQTILAVFDRFISENADRMEDLFNQMDKDKSGNITLEEFKYGLKDFGLRLTSKQMDLLLDELDADRSGTIELEELMAGTNMVEQEKQKRARAEKEAQMYQEGMVIQTTESKQTDTGDR